ncbi:hypothetical protein PHISCL_03717 [Aspergillus sclerotialis]|uniref:Uncharacterized protein n=1 Tax=Aspergillus sclerotialis TaxID=2070753 RepID=A0A3A2ZL78_9EURO|nr:hypothetical protein PHISCL_03717 [Aspergillus sclerotialis]
MSQIRMKGLDSEYTSESEQSIEGDRGGGSRYAREGPKREERLEGTRIISHSNRSRSSVSLSTTEPEIQPARPVPHYYVRNNDRRHGTARKRHTRSYIELFEPPDQTNNFDCTDKRNQNDQKIYPPVVWLVKVYKQTDERFDDNIHWQKADITYVDDKPLQVSVCDHRTEKNLQDLPPNEKGSAEEASGKRWTGPVISIERCVKADFPIRLRSSPPESVDKLNPKQISKRVIVISSPYIRIGLQKLIEYYPSFQQLILNAGEDMTKMRIEEPFSVLMHYFKTIEAFLEKDRNDVIINRDSGQAKTTDLVKEHMGHLVDFLRPVYEAPCLNVKECLTRPVLG